MGSESLKKIYPLHHHILFGRVSRKNYPCSSKINSSPFICQTGLEIKMALDSMFRLNKTKNVLWQQTHQMGLVQTGIKYPMPTVKSTAGYFIFGPVFLLEVQVQVRCSLTSSGIIGENTELLSWEKEIAIIGCQ